MKEAGADPRDIIASLLLSPPHRGGGAHLLTIHEYARAFVASFEYYTGNEGGMDAFYGNEENAGKDQRDVRACVEDPRDHSATPIAS